MGRVEVAMDPRRRCATIEVMDAEETVLGCGRVGTNAADSGCCRPSPWLPSNHSTLTAGRRRGKESTRHGCLGAVQATYPS